MGYPVIKDNAPCTLHTSRILKYGTSWGVTQWRQTVHTSLLTCFQQLPCCESQHCNMREWTNILHSLKLQFLHFLAPIEMSSRIIHNESKEISVPVVHCRTLVVVNITTLAVMAAPGPTVEVHTHLDKPLRRMSGLHWSPLRSPVSPGG